MSTEHGTAVVLAVVVTLCTGCAAVPRAPAESSPAAPTSAQVGNTTVVAVAAAPAKCMTTLPDFLGITGLGKAVGQGVGCLRNTLGMRFPGLEGKPPVLALTDPANLDPNAPPAVQAAAKIKADEDGAAQKVKAIRYLAGIGCGGCYPDVQAGLLAALDDCTEAVRYEAVKALREAAGNPCQCCRADSCCSPEVLLKLQKIAFETDGLGCYLEPSPRVRRVARLAMNACGGSAQLVTTPDEGPSEEPAEPTAAPPEGLQAAGRNPADQPLTTESALAILNAGASVDPHAVLDLPLPDAMVARVNGEPIWLREILPRVDQLLAQLNTVGSGTEQRQIRAALLAAQLQRRSTHACSVRKRNAVCRAKNSRDWFSERLPATSLWSRSRRRRYRCGRLRTWISDWPPSGARTRSDLGQQCSRQELIAYYRTHLDEYRMPAQVRWEQLTVRYDRVANREAALATLAFVRAQMQGEHLAQPAAANLALVETTVIEFTPVDALPPGPVGKSLATLSVGHVSPVLTDAQGAYLVRVLERSEPRCPTLDEVADRLRANLLQERGGAALQEHLGQLRATAAVEILLGTSPTDAPLPARSTVAASQSNPETRPVATPACAVLPWPTASPSSTGPSPQEAMRRHDASGATRVDTVTMRVWT